jgi:hypothetical protein
MLTGREGGTEVIAFMFCAKKLLRLLVSTQVRSRNCGALDKMYAGE